MRGGTSHYGQGGHLVVHRGDVPLCQRGDISLQPGGHHVMAREEGTLWPRRGHHIMLREDIQTFMARGGHHIVDRGVSSQHHETNDPGEAAGHGGSPVRLRGPTGVEVRNARTWG